MFFKAQINKKIPCIYLAPYSFKAFIFVIPHSLDKQMIIQIYLMYLNYSLNTDDTEGKIIAIFCALIYTAILRWIYFLHFIDTNTLKR
jgi:hypothetical protein